MFRLLWPIVLLVACAAPTADLTLAPDVDGFSAALHRRELGLASRFCRRRRRCRLLLRDRWDGIAVAERRVEFGVKLSVQIIRRLGIHRRLLL